MPKWTAKQIQKRFDKWGKDKCEQAHRLNRVDGEGANTIGHMLGHTTNQIDAMIDTWDEYITAHTYGCYNGEDPDET